MGARGFFCAWGQAAVDAPPRPPGAPQSQAASQHHPGVFPARQSPTGGAQQVLLRLAEQPVGRALARFCSATTLAPAWLERCPFLRCLSPAVTRSRERRCLAYLSDSSCASPARLLQSPVRGLAAPHEAGATPRRRRLASQRSPRRGVDQSADCGADCPLPPTRPARQRSGERRPERYGRPQAWRPRVSGMGVARHRRAAAPGGRLAPRWGREHTRGAAWPPARGGTAGVVAQNAFYSSYPFLSVLPIRRSMS